MGPNLLKIHDQIRAQRANKPFITLARSRQIGQQPGGVSFRQKKREKPGGIALCPKSAVPPKKRPASLSGSEAGRESSSNSR